MEWKSAVRVGVSPLLVRRPNRALKKMPENAAQLKPTPRCQSFLADASVLAVRGLTTPMELWAYAKGLITSLTLESENPPS